MNSTSSSLPVIFGPDHVYNVVQILWRYEDSENDLWVDICVDLMPSAKAAQLHQVLKLYDRIGTPLCRHVLCWPNEASNFDGLTDAENALLRSVSTDIVTYLAYAPPHDAPVLILGRYVVELTWLH